MAHSIINYLGNGTGGPFAVNFTLGFLSRSHVTAYVQGELDGAGNQIYRTITWINDGLVTVSGVVAVGAELVISRDTPVDNAQHDYQDGSVLDEQSLDESNLQSLLIAQEYADGKRLSNLSRDLDVSGYRLTGLAPPLLPSDAVPLSYIPHDFRDLATEAFAAIAANPSPYTVGSDVGPTTLEVARTDSRYIGATIIVRTNLTAAQSNISAPWPTDRALRVEQGSINPTIPFTGLPYAKPEWFNSAQKAMDASQELVLTRGITYTENIVISSSTKLITGGGTLKGSISIEGSAASPILDVKVVGIIIDLGRPDTGGNHISLKYAKDILIDTITFIGGDKCIYIHQIDATQHVARMLITRCHTQAASSSLYTTAEKANASPWTYNTAAYPNYFYYCDSPFPGNVGGTIKFGCGDVSIIANNPVLNSKGNIYVIGQDGMVISSNTFFMPGGYYRSQIKNNNIYGEYVGWLNITGNELFEAGKESILLKWVSDTAITGNIIAWPGQRDAVNGHGIKLTGGGVAPAGYTWTSSSITGNNIRIPVGHGIVIDPNTDAVTITGNTITTAGNSSVYYGDGTKPQGATATPALSGTRYGVSVDATCYGVTVTGNNSPHNYNSLPKSTSTILGPVYAAGPLNFANTETSGNSADTATVQISTITGNTITTAGKRRVLLLVAGGGTINTITGGANGDVVTFNNGSTAVTFTHTTGQIQLENGASMVLGYRRTLTLQNFAGVWWEIARSTLPTDVTSGLPVYADNAAATAGGLAVGTGYRTSTGVFMVRY